MSTRANVIIRDAHDQLIFYRHSDGYPEGVAPSLAKFLARIQTGRLRDNVSQSAGWLILIGAEEYGHRSAGMEWKVGAYEPTTSIHGDIEYLYEIDLTTKLARGWEHDGEKKGKSVTAELNRELRKADPSLKSATNGGR